MEVERIREIYLLAFGRVFYLFYGMSVNSMSSLLFERFSPDIPISWQGQKEDPSSMAFLFLLNSARGNSEGRSGFPVVMDGL